MKLMTTLRAGIAAIVIALPAQSETLGDALADAYRNSNLLEQNRALLRAADEDVAQAVAALRPILNFIAQANYSDPVAPGADRLNSSVSLSAEIVLWAGGRNRMSVDLARESVLATRQGLLQVEQNVLLQAVQAYMDVVSAAEFVDLRQSNLRLITQELRAAQDRFEVGEVTRTDVSIAEARLAASRASLSVAQGDLEVASAAFRAAVGRAPGPISGAGQAPAIPSTLEEAISIAVRGHPAIIQAQHEVQAAEIGSRIARASTSGQLSATARLSVDDEGDDASSLGLNFSKPIYQGGALSSAYRQSIAQRDAARAGLLESVRQIETQVRNSWALLQVANAQIRASQQQIRASQVAFDGVQEEAKLGARTTLDVLNAEQELLDARTARVDAGVQQVVAVYSLLASMGLLTVDHLQLGIPTYNPEAYYNAVRTAPVTSAQGQKLDRIMDSIGR